MTAAPDQHQSDSNCKLADSVPRRKMANRVPIAELSKHSAADENVSASMAECHSHIEYSSLWISCPCQTVGHKAVRRRERIYDTSL